MTDASPPPAGADRPQQTPAGTPPAGAAPAGDAVAALAREIERLRRTVTDGFAEADVPGLREQVDGLTVTLAGLAQEVAELAESGAVREKPAPSWLWPTPIPVDGDELDPARAARAAAAEAARVLGGLIDWTGRVYLRFDDAVLPECWLWHPAVVEELVWLWRAWLGAYRGKAATVQRAGDWHDRQRPGVTRRIQAAAGDCSLRVHLTPAPPARVPTVDAAAAIAAWRADPDRPAPAPTGQQIAAANARYRTAADRPMSGAAGAGGARR